MRKFIICVLVLFVSMFAFSTESRTVLGEDAKIPVLKVGHVGHDHQIALFIAALEGEKYKKYGIWMKMKKYKEVYDLMKGDKAIAELHLLKVGGGSMMPAAMERGEIQVGFGGVAAVAFFRDKGNKLGQNPLKKYY